MGAMATSKAARKIECPHCRAKPGQPCEDSRGVPMPKECHVVRRLAKAEARG